MLDTSISAVGSHSGIDLDRPIKCLHDSFLSLVLGKTRRLRRSFKTSSSAWLDWLHLQPACCRSRVRSEESSFSGLTRQPADQLFEEVCHHRGRSPGVQSGHSSPCKIPNIEPPQCVQSIPMNQEHALLFGSQGLLKRGTL